MKTIGLTFPKPEPLPVEGREPDSPDVEREEKPKKGKAKQ